MTDQDSRGHFGAPGWFAIQREVREGTAVQRLRGAQRSAAAMAEGFATLATTIATMASSVHAFNDATHQETA